MKRRNVMWWAPLVFVAGCTSKLVVDSEGSNESEASTGDGGASGYGGSGGALVGKGGSQSGGGTGGSQSGGASNGAGGLHSGGATAGTGGAPLDGEASVIGPTGPHCQGLAPKCGPARQSDCCDSSVVPGGTFTRRGRVPPGGQTTEPDAGGPERIDATVSEFRLDTYEVTVGRFRAFVSDAHRHKQAAGSGRNPNVPSDPGWLWEWNDLTTDVLTDGAFRDRELNCNGQGTWREGPRGTDYLPMNCLNYFEAYAFCIWDGGRLPTEAEWHFAAEGGAEERTYPWSVPPEVDTIDRSYAVYKTSPFLDEVGSRSPKGDGRWGHADLAGNALEWVRDWVAGEIGWYPASCTDCLVLERLGPMAGGGSFMGDQWELRGATRFRPPHTARQPDAGVRCARSVD